MAGWAYQFIAKLNFVRESWSAPVEVRRVRPAQEDANEVAAEQVKAFLRLSPEEEEEEERVAPLFVFDAGYDLVRRCNRDWRGLLRARSSSVCGRGVASTPIRVSLVHLPTLDGRLATARR